jgi:hypothetical protein
MWGSYPASLRNVGGSLRCPFVPEIMHGMVPMVFLHQWSWNVAIWHILCRRDVKPKTNKQMNIRSAVWFSPTTSIDISVAICCRKIYNIIMYVFHISYIMNQFTLIKHSKLSSILFFSFVFSMLVIFKHDDDKFKRKFLIKIFLSQWCMLFRSNYEGIFMFV